MRLRIMFLVVSGLIGTSVAYAHGLSAADKQNMLEGGYLQYMSLGATHMLTGYDHLLFLFGVIFFLTQFKDIVKFITAFTVGHSITLIGATFMGISVNYFLIDAVIALTVFYKGFDNNGGFKKYLNISSPNLVKLVFIFGLIHGLGLSTRLQQLPLGEVGLLLKIISFNVGVEGGQILALSVMLFALTRWRKTDSFAKFCTASNVGLMVAGLVLFLMQMHGYTHDVFVNDLAFSKEIHRHEHLAMEKEMAATTSAAQEVAKDDNPTPSQKSPWKDSITIMIPSGQGIEYKFHVVKGALLEYSWTATGGQLLFDFHGEPTGDTTGYFESFKKGTHSESHGSFTAPFEGAHGWYWENGNPQNVEVVLKTKGSYKILGIR